QYGFGFYRIEGQVSKTAHAHQVRPLDAQHGIIRYQALKYTDDTASHDHHDKETRTLSGIWSQTGYGECKNTGPKGGAEKTYTDKCIYANLTIRQHANKQSSNAAYGEDQQLTCRVTATQEVARYECKNNEGINIKRCDVVVCNL